MRADPAAALWRFSVALYARPGVANALIGLQDRLGLDVNLVLFCLWCAASGRTSSAAAMRAAVRSTRRWQARTVGRLRAIRRELKQDLGKIADPKVAAAVARLREAVKRLEIEAERIEHMVLARASGAAGAVSCEAAATAARANL